MNNRITSSPLIGQTPFNEKMQQPQNPPFRTLDSIFPGPAFPGVPRVWPAQPVVSPFLIPQKHTGRAQDGLLKVKVDHFIGSTLKCSEGVKRTHFILLLDQSTSMLNGKTLTLAGFNQQVQVIRANAADAGQITVSVVLFDTQVKPLFVGMPLTSLKELTEASYLPNGGTALYDATGSVLEIAMALPGANDPSTAVFVQVLTDGEDLNSQHVSGKAVGACVKRLTETGRFTFALMGPQEHLNDLANVLSLDRGNVDGFDPLSIKSRASSVDAMAGSMQSYMSSRSTGATAVNNLYKKSGPTL